MKNTSQNLGFIELKNLVDAKSGSLTDFCLFVKDLMDVNQSVEVINLVLKKLKSYQKELYNIFTDFYTFFSKMGISFVEPNMNRISDPEERTKWILNKSLNHDFVETQNIYTTAMFKSVGVSDILKQYLSDIKKEETLKREK